MGTLNLNINQILDVIKSLPVDEKTFLKTFIEKDIETPQIHFSLTQKLLNGPVMSDEQYEAYIQLRNEFDVWEKKLS